jgi:hypothetical protein
MNEGKYDDDGLMSKKWRMHGVSLLPIMVTVKNKEISHTQYDAKL